MKKFLVLLAAIMTAALLAACHKIDFRLNFVSDGAVYSVIDIENDKTIKLPEDPQKEDYEFEGWYWDDGEWEKPFTVNSLLNTPLSSDMNVYARFRHLHCTFDKETVIEPTCTEQGYTLHECECGESIKTDYVPTAAHTYGDWQTKKEASQTSMGIKERVCSVCGYVDRDFFLYTPPQYTVEETPPSYTIATPDFSFGTGFETIVVEPIPFPSSSSMIDATIYENDDVYVVTIDDIPESYDGNISNVVSDIFESNDFPIENFENRDILIYVKDEAGEYVPLPITD